MNKLEKINKPVNSNLDEAAWAYYDKNKPLIPHELDLHKEMINFFIAGAQWQKEQMIDKACEWLEEHLLDFWTQKITNTDYFIEEFKQAMEE